MGILLFIIFSGASTYITMPKESSPDVSIPIVYISLNQNGISAQDSERLLVKPIEDEVKTVEGVREVRSTAYSGGRIDRIKSAAFTISSRLDMISRPAFIARFFVRWLLPARQVITRNPFCRKTSAQPCPILPGIRIATVVTCFGFFINLPH